MSEFIEFRSIEFSYQKNQSLFTDLNFSIPQYKSTALLGLNGAGKSTIMDLLLGWRSPHQGDIFVKGQSLKKLTARQRGQFMSLVPQDEAIHFDYTVLEYLLLGRAPYLPLLGRPGKRDFLIVDQVLNSLGLGSFKKRIISELSGGERQLMLLARALVQEPDFLLLDEPSSHLDIANREKMLSCLKNLKERGITLFFTSHDPEFLTRLADHVLVLDKGHIDQSGPTQEVLSEQTLEHLYQVPVEKVLYNKRTLYLWGDE